MERTTVNCNSDKRWRERPCPRPVTQKILAARDGRPTKEFLQNGYTLAGVLVLIAIMSIFMAMSVPIWDRIKQRENEDELVFRGTEYVEAIARYHKRFNSYPPDLKTLFDQKFVRKLYKDPMTESGEWKVLHPDSLVQTGVAGQIEQPGAAKPDDKDKTKDQDKSKDKDKDKDKSENQSPGLNPTLKDQDEDEAESDSDQGIRDDLKEVSLGPVVGVVSRSKKSSLRIYNGQSTYNKWIFAFVPQQQEQQPPPAPKPGDKGSKNPKPVPKTPSDKSTNQNEDDHN
jgi:type II secretory pathway pseudopilin PulG